MFLEVLTYQVYAFTLIFVKPQVDRKHSKIEQKKPEVLDDFESVMKNVIAIRFESMKDSDDSDADDNSSGADDWSDN